MFSLGRVALLKSLVRNVTSFKYLRTSTVNPIDAVKSTNLESGVNDTRLKSIDGDDDSEKVLQRLMTFFDLPDNWGQSEVKSGRGWRIDELRIKSNEDLHKLWYVLYKERNMLLTMQEAAKDEVDNMASPERIDKVEESMKNIEEVIKERNRAYWQLEVGDTDYVSRPKVFRRDVFGRWRWIACSEHLVPYWMNKKWREMNAPGFGQDVIDFNRKLRERKQNKQVGSIFKQAFYCRQLMKRFDTLDLDYLQEKFPLVDVHFIKNQLNEYALQDRSQRFNSIFYQKGKTDQL